MTPTELAMYTGRALVADLERRGVERINDPAVAYHIGLHLKRLLEVERAARALFGAMTERLTSCPLCGVEDSTLCAEDCEVNALSRALGDAP